MGDFHSIDSSIKCNLFGKYSFLEIFSLLVVIVVVSIRLSFLSIVSCVVRRSRNRLAVASTHTFRLFSSHVRHRAYEVVSSTLD